MKISRRLSFWTLSALFFMGAAGLFAHYLLMVSGAAQELDSLANTVAPVIEEGLSNSMISRDARVLSKTLMTLERIELIDRIVLANREGFVKAGTGIWTADSRVFREGKERQSSPGGRWVDDESGKERIYRWMQAVRNRPECHGCHDPKAKINGFVVVDFSMRATEMRWREHIAKESLLFVVVFLCAGVVVFQISNTMVIRRLDGVVKAMQNFEPSGPASPVPVSGDDEITRLGEGFNEMAESIALSQKEMKRHADELLALAVSSQVITAVPRTEDIYEAACNIAVKELKMKMAWIGLLTEGGHDLDPVAQSGFEDGYLSGVRITCDDSPTGRGPTGRAVRTKTPQVMNDMDADPAYALWRDEAQKRGYRSSMALPLLTSEADVIGVLNLYSGEPAYFTRKRIRMFMIFANQAATAFENRMLIENLERRSGEIVDQFKVISRSQKEWRLTFDSITDLITIHDREFRVIKANRAAAEYLGVKVEEMINRKCHELFHGTCAPVANCPHRTSLEEDRVSTEEVLDPKTNRIFSVSTFPYHSAEGEFIGSVHIAKDITDEREKEMRLIMSERLAALGQMSSGIAHEINNPLASIAGCAEGLLIKVRKGLYDPAVFEEYLHIIHEEIHRCKSITTGMLSFVRKTAYEKKDVKINETLDKTLEIIGFQGRLRQVDIRRNYASDMPALHGSEGELRQVFLAIITNSLDAMENKGVLVIRTFAQGDRACVKITDTGPGIPPEDATRIFDPFFTTKSEKGGTGLGLSIAHKIITNHGGSIDVVSGEGKGATFEIIIPLS